MVSFEDLVVDKIVYAMNTVNSLVFPIQTVIVGIVAVLV